ncbi:hypothetical protein Tco_0318052 [Tanacetum coccineum]
MLLCMVRLRPWRLSRRLLIAKRKGLVWRWSDSWLQFRSHSDKTKRASGSSRSYTETRESQTRRCRRYDQEGYTKGEVRDIVTLKVSPWEGVVHFGKREKLNPRYVGLFQVLAKVEASAYKLKLPQEFSRVHNTFYVSNLKKCYADEPLYVPLDRLHFVKSFNSSRNQSKSWITKSNN